MKRSIWIASKSEALAWIGIIFGVWLYLLVFQLTSSCFHFNDGCIACVLSVHANKSKRKRRVLKVSTWKCVTNSKKQKVSWLSFMHNAYKRISKWVNRTIRQSQTNKKKEDDDSSEKKFFKETFPSPSNTANNQTKQNEWTNKRQQQHQQQRSRWNYGKLFWNFIFISYLHIGRFVWALQ